MPSYKFKPGHPLADANGFVTTEDYYRHYYATSPDLRAEIDGKTVIMRYNSDQMDPTRNHADGRMYTSKKQFSAATKRAGCIEVGNELPYIERRNFEAKAKMFSPGTKADRIQDIKKSIQQLKNKM